MKRRTLITLAPTALALSGCVSLSEKTRQEARFFALHAASGTMAKGPAVDWQLIIEPPTSSAALSTTRIAVQRDTYELEYFARANWVDDMPSMVQRLMVESFENSRRIVAVGRESFGLRADFVLKTELRDFQAQIDAEGRTNVRVLIVARLVAMPDRSIVAAFHKTSEVDSVDSQIDNVVAAFDQALKETMSELVDWALAAGHKNTSEES